MVNSDPSGLREEECSDGVAGCRDGRSTGSSGGKSGGCKATDSCQSRDRNALPRTFGMRGGNELVLTEDGAYLNGVLITGAWDDPLELARDVIETMEEHGFSSSGWDTVKALYVTCQNLEKYSGCKDDYSKTLSDTYDIAMCATEKKCVDIEYCIAETGCKYVNAEDILESAIEWELQNDVGDGDGFSMVLSVAVAAGLGAPKQEDTCSVHGSVMASACGVTAAGNDMINGKYEALLNLFWGCAANSAAPSNACLGALVGVGNWAMGSYGANLANTRLATGIWGNELQPSNPWD